MRKLHCHTSLTFDDESQASVTAGKSYSISEDSTGKSQYMIINDLQQEHFFDKETGTSASYDNWFVLGEPIDDECSDDMEKRFLGAYDTKKIILEGSDASRKSTIAHKLTKRLSGSKYVHGSSFENAKTDNETLFKGFMELAKHDSDQQLILDRFIYSNLVYASIYKDYSIIDRDQALAIQAAMGESLLVYLYASEDELIRRMKERGEDEVKPSEVSKILAKYDEVIVRAESDGVRTLYLNTEYLSSDQCVQIILDNYQTGAYKMWRNYN